MPPNIKFSKAQISEIILSSESFGSWLSNLGNKGLTNIAISLARDNLPALVSNWNSYSIHNFKRKISGIGAVRERKRFILFTSIYFK